MKTIISPRTVVRALPLFSILSLVVAQAPTDEGCFSSAGELTNQGSYTYQSPSYCQKQCVGQGKAVYATTNGSDCYCGDKLPSSGDKTSDSDCSSHCNGFGQLNCGGTSAWSVGLTGTNSNPGSSGSSSGSSNSGSSAAAASSADSTTSQTTSASPVATSSSTSAAAPSPSTTKSSQPSVVTHASTVVVTAPGQTQPTTTVVTTTSTPSQKSGPNVAGIAAGVVVGVVALTAIVGGLFFFLRSRKRRAVEEEHRNNLGGWYGNKPPTSSSGSISDSRLEPSVMMQRRQSDGSIADNQDYSRRILKVTNPDGS